MVITRCVAVGWGVWWSVGVFWVGLAGKGSCTWGKETVSVSCSFLAL